jgi:hypothetical protein
MTTGLDSVYTRAVHQRLKQFATWPVGSLISLGDYGTLEDERFKRLGNIQDDFGIECKGVESPVRMVFDFKSAEVEETSIKAGAKASEGSGLASANAKALLKFGKGDSIYFRSIKLSYSRIDNFSEVRQGIMQKFKTKEWNGKYAFVHDLFHSGGTTVIISSSDDAVIEIEAGVKGLEQIDLADGSAKLSSVHDVNVGLKVIANKVDDIDRDKLVPLFSLSAVRPRFWWFPFLGGRTVKPMMADLTGQDNKNPVAGALSGRLLASLDQEVSPGMAEDVGKDIEEVFDVVPLR